MPQRVKIFRDDMKRYADIISKAKIERQ